MRIKSFFTKSVDEAMVQARSELGSDALLLNTRRVPAEDGKPGGYEVVFGVAGDDPQPAPAKPRVEVRAPARGPSPIEPKASIKTASQPKDNTAAELRRLHAQMDEIRSLIVRSSRSHGNIGRTVPELADIYARLLEAEVDPVLSKDIVDRLEASIATDAFFDRAGTGSEKTANRWKAIQLNSYRLEAFLRAELERRVSINPQLGMNGENGSVAVFVGPTGAGKTTSLVKLAASRLGAPSGKPIRVLTLDTSRPSGPANLQAWASTLGIGFSPVPSIHMLPGMVAEARKTDLVLIDTPGYGGNDRTAVETAAGLLAKCFELDVHLVVPGYMKITDLRRCLQRYEVFRPANLLVTKLDESHALGSVFSEAVRAGISLSFLADGPAVPNDIRPASIDDLVAMALDGSRARAQSVA